MAWSQARVTRPLLLVSLALAILALAVLDTNALCLLPALALAAPLLMRRYLGERTLARLWSARRGDRWPRLPGRVPGGARALAVAPHGGLLIACSLAVRPPPALSTAI